MGHIIAAPELYWCEQNSFDQSDRRSFLCALSECAQLSGHASANNQLSLLGRRFCGRLY